MDAAFQREDGSFAVLTGGCIEAVMVRLSTQDGMAIRGPLAPPDV